MFVHGYNVNAPASRLWAIAMFKRLWWAGSRAAFTAVDWKGDDSQMSVPAKGDISPNYYVNVKNAFMTADALTRLCGMLSGEKVMLAHSLGNVLVSSAAVDHGLSYSRYYMLNAAVPMEAYDEGEKDDLMVDGAWKGIDERFRSSRFSDLFNSTTNDFRWGLSWKGRFNGIRNAINCYSPTEDVLANPAHVKVFGVQSFAAGANVTRGVDGNYDMQSELPNEWPQDIGEDLPNGGRKNVWRHSDIKNVAFWYVYLLFKRLLL